MAIPVATKILVTISRLNEYESEVSIVGGVMFKLGCVFCVEQLNIGYIGEVCQVGNLAAVHNTN